jgi:uncharacterized protein YjbI with pentapeptide repeats
MRSLTNLGLVLVLLVFCGCRSIASDYKNGERDFRKSNLRFANLKGQTLNKADLSGSNLVWAKFDQASLKGTFLRFCNTTGASFYGADLRDADLRGTFIGTADFSRANLKNADLRGLNFSQAKLANANFAGCQLNQANLRGLDLSQTNIHKAILVIARYDEKTVWPSGFDPTKAGAVMSRIP